MAIFAEYSKAIAFGFGFMIYFRDENTKKQLRLIKKKPDQMFSVKAIEYRQRTCSTAPRIFALALIAN